MCCVLLQYKLCCLQPLTHRLAACFIAVASFIIHCFGRMTGSGAVRRRCERDTTDSSGSGGGSGSDGGSGVIAMPSCSDVQQLCGVVVVSECGILCCAPV